MTLPASPNPISMSQVNDELGFATTATLSLYNTPYLRTLFGVPSGTISMSSGRGKTLAGSQTYNTPGTYSFTVPLYKTMTVTVNGGGGGGKGGGGTVSSFLLENGTTEYTYVSGSQGGSGTLSRFNAPTNLIANPGTGGGSNGTATGGDTNTTGGAGNGGNGGTGNDNGLGGNPPDGFNGGNGGRAVSTYIRTSGGLTVGAVISLTVGSRGSGGSGAGGGSSGSSGGYGSVVISWT